VRQARPLTVAGRLGELRRRWLRELDGEPLLICAGVCVILTVSHYQGSTSFFRRNLAALFTEHPAASALPYFWWFGASVLLYLFVPLGLSAVAGGSFTRRYGLGLGDWRAGLLISAVFLLVMIPAVYVAAQTEVFGRQYPLAGQWAYTLQRAGVQERSLTLFLAYQAAYFLYFVGWEFLFRGWMLNGLLPRFGRGGAILVQTLPFVLLHFGKPQAEALGSIVAGIALGVLALRTRSFWYGALLHGVIAVWMDVLVARPYLGPA
jgi:uncharacterized protein